MILYKREFLILFSGHLIWERGLGLYSAEESVKIEFYFDLIVKREGHLSSLIMLLDLSLAFLSVIYF